MLELSSCFLHLLSALQIGIFTHGRQQARATCPHPLENVKGLDLLQLPRFDRHKKNHATSSGVARNLIWEGGVYVLTSHCNFNTCVNMSHT